jgi:VIT1/CCC1 family predicted Fe2+/Mn2+ transporter
VTPAFARGLVLDELFDLTLYRVLIPTASPGLRPVLEELVPVERRHYEFWRGFLGLDIHRLDAFRRVKLALLTAVCRVFGDGAIQLVLEGIEIHGIRKYLTVWESTKGTPFGDAVRQILEDELSHEDAIVLAGSSQRMDPETVRSIFLGFNDGCVEILGAVSGFMAAFGDAKHVLMASVSVAVAGAISMGAGAFVSADSARELGVTAEAKKRFLHPPDPVKEGKRSPLFSAILVGVSYAVGALVPVVPVLLGAQGPLPTILAAGAAIVLFSSGLAFLSGMAVRRRAALNLVIIAAAVGLSWGIGHLARRLWGISL